jgi:hypothetical protein
LSFIYTWSDNVYKHTYIHTYRHCHSSSFVKRIYQYDATEKKEIFFFFESIPWIQVFTFLLSYCQELVHYVLEDQRYSHLFNRYTLIHGFNFSYFLHLCLNWRSMSAQSFLVSIFFLRICVCLYACVSYQTKLKLKVKWERGWW